MFSVHAKTQSRRFEIPSVRRANFRDGFLHTDELKMALRARNVSGAFEKRGPGYAREI